MLKTIAVILAAGQGKRMKAGVNKQFLLINSKPILAHTLAAFESHPLIDGIILVVKEDEINICREEIINFFQFSKVIDIIAGGKERQDSVFQGILALPKECSLVVVHDGARPFIAGEIISCAIEKGLSTGACITAVPVKDTIKRVNSEKRVMQTLVREELWAVQTPQVFKKNILVEAYEFAWEKEVYGTDDASLVELWGHEVAVAMGSYENIKITTPEDLELGKVILSKAKNNNRFGSKSIF